MSSRWTVVGKMGYCRYCQPRHRKFAGQKKRRQVRGLRGDVSERIWKPGKSGQPNERHVLGNIRKIEFVEEIGFLA